MSKLICSFSSQLHSDVRRHRFYLAKQEEVKRLCKLSSVLLSSMTISLSHRRWMSTSLQQQAYVFATFTAPSITTRSLHGCDVSKESTLGGQTRKKHCLRGRHSAEAG